ncbi:zinc/manganese transport system substrate-binding protein [Microlunatus sagamiharensis]|uniref:Zinc/manganese transport system substrate-binding protein n=1 Tax=Microlunatus sagamiharensis TaxID=546874 RepID=A0A1H2N1Y9_9ACTN|nr:zinc ABC transporter substrate-binding protein [Microlunatus sagamiharensis]SDU99392.1 zinc/manganese transport system substrate-binding protein [Microlunatus sagamiharensis]
MRRLLVPALPAAALLLGLTACSGSAGSAAPASSGAAGTVSVVASTNVYGDIVKTIGGDAVEVTSIIDDPSQDPHEYTANARTQLALSKAQLVVENGGGYDDFVATMLSATTAKPRVLNVADVSGYDQEPAEGEFNEHLWYDFPTMVKLTDQVQQDLSAIAPDRAETFRTNAAAFTTKLEGLEKSEETLAAEHRGTGVAITEPVPLYLLDASGLVNRTPEEFSEAIEEGSDVPPAVLQETEALFSGKKVGLLAYNEQTTGPQTEAVLAAAKSAGVPVVGMTETLPAGLDYVGWMQRNLDAVGGALQG